MADKRNIAEIITAADLECLVAYAEANMMATVAAEKTFRHRSTVKYHLEQVKQKTGLDPENFFDLAKLMVMVWRFADVAEVVRCHECTHCQKKDMFGLKETLECQRIDRSVAPEHYCSYGERRDGDAP